MAGVFTFMSGFLGKNFAKKQLQQFYQKHRIPLETDLEAKDEGKDNRRDFYVKAIAITGDFNHKFWEKIASSDTISKAIDAAAIKYLEGLFIASKTNTQTPQSDLEIKEKLQQYFIDNITDKDVAKIQKEYKKATSMQNEGLKLLADSIVGRNITKAGQAVNSFLDRSTFPRLGSMKPTEIDKKELAMQLTSQLWVARRFPKNEEIAAKNVSAILASLPQQLQKKTVLAPLPKDPTLDVIPPQQPINKQMSQPTVFPVDKAKVPTLPKEVLAGVTLNSGLKEHDKKPSTTPEKSPIMNDATAASMTKIEDSALQVRANSDPLAMRLRTYTVSHNAMREHKEKQQWIPGDRTKIVVTNVDPDPAPEKQKLK